MDFLVVSNFVEALEKESLLSATINKEINENKQCLLQKEWNELKKKRKEEL